MCGWVGVFGRRVPVERLDAATDLLTPRGPDSRGTLTVEVGDRPAVRWPYGVGHRRLSIIDLSPSGAQPMVDEDRGLVLTYNGELYNSPALRRELQGKGHRFRGTSDTEVLLRGYAEWGDAVLERIEGIFSFALVDEPKGRVLLARDRLGIKPLYWARRGDALLAGSAPRSLLLLEPELGRDLDRVAIAQFLSLLWVPHPRTPWSSIQKLPPGTALAFDGSATRTWRYWEPPTAEPGRELAPKELLETIATATTGQLLADVPVGLLFSGGLDSSLLLALMREHYGDGALDAYTAGYDPASQQLEVNPDDAVYARDLAGTMPQVALHEVEIDIDAEADLEDLVDDFDDPVADPAAISLLRLCRATDHKVLLSGVGGEELWAGYPRHRGLALARRVASLPDPVRRALTAPAGRLQGARPGPAYAARRNAEKLLRSLGDRRPPHYWRMMAQLTFREMDALVPGAATAAYDELDAQSPALASATLAEALDFDRRQFLPNLNLAYVDKASMRASVEVRVPLLDESVVDLTFAADPASFIRDGVTKAPLKDAARGVVADQVIDRPKSGFGGPARAWFQGRTGDRLGQRIEAAADAGLVDRAPARRIHDDAATGRRDAALSAWALVCLQAWHEAHRAPPAPSGAGGRW